MVILGGWMPRPEKQLLHHKLSTQNLCPTQRPPDLRQSAPEPHLHLAHTCPGGRCQGVQVLWWNSAHALRAVRHFAWLEVDSVKVALSCPTHQRVPRRSMRGRPRAVGRTPCNSFASEESAGIEANLCKRESGLLGVKSLL